MQFANKPSGHALAGAVPASLRWSGLALFTCAVVFLGLLVTHPFDGAAYTAATDFASVTAVGLATAFAMVAAVRSQARARFGWSLFASGLFSWALGEAIWTAYEVVLGRETPFPSVADIGYLAMVPATFAGILILSPNRRSLAQVRTVLDAAAVSLLATAVIWHVAVRRMYEASDASSFAKALSAAYPVGDLLLVFALVTVLGHHLRGPRAAVFGTLWAGLAVFLAADVGFAIVAMNDAYVAGSLIDAGWVFGFLLMGLASAMQACWRLPYRSSDSDRAAPVWRQAMPLAVAGAVCVLFAAPALPGFDSDAVFLALTGLAGVVVLIRQTVVVRDNVALNHRLADARDELERRVDERTRQLAASEQRFKALAQNASDLVTVITADTTIRYQSPSLTRVLGYPEDAMRDRRLTELVAEPDHAALLAFLAEASSRPGATATAELRVLHKDGSWRWVEIVGSDERLVPAIAGFVLNARDVSERKALEDQLRHSAFHDPLTGLANRERFRDRLDHALHRIGRSGRSVGVIFLDLDNFKSVNDTLGHSSGDELLTRVAERLESCVRAEDTAARFGGDEFAVLLEEINAPEDAYATAERIVESLRSPFQITGKELAVQASLGIAISSGAGVDPEELLQEADIALYAAKARGKARFELYEPGMRAGLVARLELLNDLTAALDRGEFFLQYQPTVDLDTTRIVAVEALVRWRHPERGVVPPMDFIPLAEESGAIVPLGRWVLREACMTVRRWHQEFPGDPIAVSVNASAREIQQPGFVDGVAAVLQETGFPPSSLVIELTESAMLSGGAAVLATLQALKRLGIRLAIDDFGTGYSSLSYLAEFPFDILKVDRSFVGGETPLDNGRELTRAILDMARTLHLRTVAEGIERADQLAVLRSMDGDFGQGYLFAKPLFAEDVENLLAAGEPTIAA